MDALGYVCILLIAVAIVALIVVNKKRSEISEFETPAEDPMKVKVDEPPVQQYSQQTIYEYIQTETVRICPGCDGENDKTVRFCAICGYDLMQEGV